MVKHHPRILGHQLDGYTFPTSSEAVQCLHLTSLLTKSFSWTLEVVFTFTTTHEAFFVQIFCFSSSSPSELLALCFSPSQSHSPYQPAHGHTSPSSLLPQPPFLHQGQSLPLHYRHHNYQQLGSICPKHLCHHRKEQSRQRNSSLSHPPRLLHSLTPPRRLNHMLELQPLHPLCHLRRDQSRHRNS